MSTACWPRSSSTRTTRTCRRRRAGPLIEVAKRYGVGGVRVGRRASDARRVVSLGSIAYLGSHGSEILHPGSIAPEMDRELQAWTRRVQNFAREAYSESLRKQRVRLEDKEAIAALHWRDVPDEEEAERSVREVAEAAEKAGFNAHWGRKVLEIRPPVRIDKGAGIVSLLRDRELEAALVRGRRHHGHRRVPRPERAGGAGLAEARVRVGVSSGDETPSELEAEADVMVDGTDGVRDLLRELIR
jgi:trehalose 6-phosphate phosphatase